MVWDEEVAAVIGLDEPAMVVAVDVDNEAVDTTDDGISGGGSLLFVGCSLSLSSNDRSSGSSLTCIFSIFFFKRFKSPASIHNF